MNRNHLLSLEYLLHFDQSNSKIETAPKIAICLVGGARRFELTGPSIIKNVLQKYPNADLFLNSPFDKDSYKFLLLKNAPRIASVRIFVPEHINQTETQERLLTSNNSPNGIQGLLQYFNLVEGCLDLISSHESKHHFTYDWIVRTRVDGYWSGPLEPESFTPGCYTVPEGSRYGGLNDRLGIGDRNTSTIALSRLSLIPKLDSAGFVGLNSESAFKAQLDVSNVTAYEMRFPFCVVSDRQYSFPPSGYGVPVAYMGSEGALSGAKCRPCRPICNAQCAEQTMEQLGKNWSWMESKNNSVSLCDASGEWPNDWEIIFDKLAGKYGSTARKKITKIDVNRCIKEFEAMKQRSEKWEAPKLEKICHLGLMQSGSSST